MPLRGPEQQSWLLRCKLFDKHFDQRCIRAVVAGSQASQQIDHHDQRQRTHNQPANRLHGLGHNQRPGSLRRNLPAFLLQQVALAVNGLSAYGDRSVGLAVKLV
jgi:hypothetical protein